MAVITKQLIKELEIQTELMHEPEKLTVIAKLIHPMVDWEWYLICFAYFYDYNTIHCILNGLETEFGMIGTKEINTHKPHGMAFEIDKDFKSCNARELFLKLKKISV